MKQYEIHHEDELNHLAAQRNEAMDGNVKLQALIDSMERYIAELEAQLKEQDKERQDETPPVA